MILITGAAGLIGSNIAFYLNSIGHRDLILVDQLRSSEKWKNLTSLNYRDYYEKEQLSTLLKSGKIKPSTIFHMGACSDTTEKNASYLIENNFQFSKELFLISQDIGAKFIYASSAATYGEGENGYCDNETDIDMLRPLNMYGYSKQMFDQWLLHNGYMSSAVGLKYFNVYGPNEYHKGQMRSLVLKAYEQIVQNGQINLFKSYKPEYQDGEQMRDFLYVKDAAKMTVHFMDSAHSGIFNLGTSECRTWNDLAKSIFSAMKLQENIQYIDMPEELKEKYQYYTKADISKLRSTGYTESLMSIEDAVEDYVQRYLVNQSHL